MIVSIVKSSSFSSGVLLVVKAATSSMFLSGIARPTLSRKRRQLHWEIFDGGLEEMVGEPFLRMKWICYAFQTYHDARVRY